MNNQTFQYLFNKYLVDTPDGEKIKFSSNNTRYEGYYEKLDLEQGYLVLRDCVRVEGHHKFQEITIKLSSIDFLFI